MRLLEKLSSELEDLVHRVTPSVVGVEHDKGRATGFVLADDGYVITNAHVVYGRTKNARIHMTGHAPLPAEVVAWLPSAARPRRRSRASERCEAKLSPR